MRTCVRARVCVCVRACVRACVCEIIKYVVTRSMFKNVSCSVNNVQCVHVLCERGSGLKTNTLSCSCSCIILSAFEFSGKMSTVWQVESGQ